MRLVLHVAHLSRCTVLEKPPGNCTENPPSSDLCLKVFRPTSRADHTAPCGRVPPSRRAPACPPRRRCRRVLSQRRAPTLSSPSDAQSRLQDLGARLAGVSSPCQGLLRGPLAGGRSHPARCDLVQRYEKTLPTAVRCFLDDFEACIAHLRFPVKHRRVIRDDQSSFCTCGAWPRRLVD